MTPRALIFVLLLGVSCARTNVASFSPLPTTQSTRIVVSSSSIKLCSWQDKLTEILGGLLSENPQESVIVHPQDVDETASGVVIRLAARKYDTNSSKPSSRTYTTRKEKVASVLVTKAGVEGDYNHYRTAALKSTEDRAVSILTSDVTKSIRATYRDYKFEEGDLGENILVDGVPFAYFRVGQQYQFVNEGENSVVVVEITEPAEPCANLCKLPYINDDSITGKDRIARCQDFIKYLDRYDGYRGWYAKVVEDGVIQNGATVSVVQDDES